METVRRGRRTLRTLRLWTPGTFATVRMLCVKQKGEEIVREQKTPKTTQRKKLLTLRVQGQNLAYSNGQTVEETHHLELSPERRFLCLFRGRK